MTILECNNIETGRCVGLHLDAAADGEASHGATSLSAIAAGLNERKIPTARGTGEWSAVQVMRVLARQAVIGA